LEVFIKVYLSKHVALFGVLFFAGITLFSSMQTRNSQIALAQMETTTSATKTSEIVETVPVEATPAQAVIAPAPTVVVVRAGDSLSKIAEENGTTFKRLFDANPEIVDPNVLITGQQIRVPFPDEQLVERALPAPKPAVAQSAPSTPIVSNAPAVADGSVWDRLAACESGGRWNINTGNGYYGGLQFSLSTWRAVGGSGLPSDNTREEQIARAEILLARSGWGQWPACTAKLGLR
jgi:LysM repeat protein